MLIICQSAGHLARKSDENRSWLPSIVRYWNCDTRSMEETNILKIVKVWDSVDKGGFVIH